MLGAEAMDAVLVGRDVRSGRLERAPEAYRPVAHGQRRAGSARDPLSERLGRERGGGAAPARRRARRRRTPRRAARRAPRGRRARRRASGARARSAASEARHADERQVARLRKPRAVAMPMRRPGEAARPDADRQPRRRRPSPRPPPPAPPRAAPSSRAACAGPLARRRVVARPRTPGRRRAARRPTVAAWRCRTRGRSCATPIRAVAARVRERDVARDAALAEQRVEPAPLRPLHERDQRRAPKYGSSSPGSSSSSAGEPVEVEVRDRAAPS